MAVDLFPRGHRGSVTRSSLHCLHAAFIPLVLLAQCRLLHPRSADSSRGAFLVVQGLG